MVSKALASAPEEYLSISQTPLSLARQYGGCTIQGHDYIYYADRDALVRKDVVERRQQEALKAEKTARNNALKQANDAQSGFDF